MKAFIKTLAGAATAAALTIGAASPAQAQFFGDPYSRNRGLNVGDIITGVAVMGGIQSIMSALGNDGSRYGYAYRDRYQNDYRNAVNACAYEAQRRGGQISVTDVERRGYDSYRVRGVIDAGYGYGNVGRYDRYGSYGNYGNYGSFGGYGDRVAFACTARADGRVRDFDTGRL